MTEPTESADAGDGFPQRDLPPHSSRRREPAAGPTGPDATAPSARRDDAFAQHVVPELDVLLRVARTLTRHDAEAEDLVQDTVLRAYRAIDRFDGAHPRAWLLTILRNVHINRNRCRRPELLRDPDRSADTLADGELGSDPEQTVLDGLVDEHVAAALAALPDRFRAVVVLVDLGDLSYEEAARALEIPLGTVMSRLHRARRRMRDQLVAAGVRPPGGPA